MAKTPNGDRPAAWTVGIGGLLICGLTGCVGELLTPAPDAKTDLPGVERRALDRARAADSASGSRSSAAPRAALRRRPTAPLLPAGSSASVSEPPMSASPMSASPMSASPTSASPTSASPMSASPMSASPTEPPIEPAPSAAPPAGEPRSGPAGALPFPVVRPGYARNAAELLSVTVDQPMLPTLPGAESPPPIRLTLAEAIHRAVAHSHLIRQAAFTPAIRATDILEAQGLFDPVVFLRGDGNSEGSGNSGILYRNRDQPLGQPFGVGGGPAGGESAAGIESREFAFRFGIRQRLPTGATVAINQRFTHVESNNPFLSPNPQSTANINVSIAQPLLRGAGLDTNRATIFIGVNNRELGIQDFRRQVIGHLLDVEQAYWNLLLARLNLAVLERLLAQQSETARQLRERRADTLPYVRDRAAASVANTEANIIQARVTVRDGQDRLKVLLNDPSLSIGRGGEIIPAEPLLEPVIPVDEPALQAAMAAALENRPEILSARLNIRNAAVREGLSRNELLPQLNVIAETLPQGLQGQLSTAFRDQWRFQFQDWIFGLVFEVPLSNRTARARYRRETLNREQLVEALSATIQTSYFEVSTSLRALENRQGQIPARRRSLEAAASELVARQGRLFLETSIPTALDLLLSSQDRLAQAATALYQSQVDYATAIVRLEQSKGTLLYYNNIDVLEEAHRLAEPGHIFEPRDVVPAAPARSPR